MLSRHGPRRLWALRGEAVGDEGQYIGVRQMAREREFDGTLQLHHAAGGPTNVARIVAKVAPRQRDFFGAARRSACEQDHAV